MIALLIVVTKILIWAVIACAGYLEYKSGYISQALNQKAEEIKNK